MCKSENGDETDQPTTRETAQDGLHLQSVATANVTSPKGKKKKRTTTIRGKVKEENGPESLFSHPLLGHQKGKLSTRFGVGTGFNKMLPL